MFDTWTAGGAGRDVEPLGQLGVGEPLGHEGQDLPLAGGELDRGRRTARRRAARAGARAPRASATRQPSHRASRRAASSAWPRPPRSRRASSRPGPRRRGRWPRSVAHTRRSTSRIGEDLARTRDARRRRRPRPGRGGRRTAAASARRGVELGAAPAPDALRPAAGRRRRRARIEGAGTSSRHADRRRRRRRPALPGASARAARRPRPCGRTPARPPAWSVIGISIFPGSCPGCRRRARRRGRPRPARGAAGWCGGRSTPPEAPDRVDAAALVDPAQRLGQSPSAQASSMRPSM